MRVWSIQMPGLIYSLQKTLRAWNGSLSSSKSWLHVIVWRRDKEELCFLSNSYSSAEWSLTGTNVTTISALLTHPTGSPRSWMNHCTGRVSVLTRADKLPVKQTPKNSKVRLELLNLDCLLLTPPLLISNLSFSSCFYPVRLVVGLGSQFIPIPSPFEIK